MSASQPGPGVTFSLRLVRPDDGSDEAIKTLRAVLGPTGACAGCLRCTLLEDVQRPNELHLLVKWRSREDFERHVKTELFRSVLQAVDLSTEPPDLEVQTITDVHGMELLREILGYAKNGKETPT